MQLWQLDAAGRRALAARRRRRAPAPSSTGAAHAFTREHVDVGALGGVADQVGQQPGVVDGGCPAAASARANGNTARSRTPRRSGVAGRHSASGCGAEVVDVDDAGRSVPLVSAAQTPDALDPAFAGSAVSGARAGVSLWRDLVALGKPGITMMAVIVAAGTFVLDAAFPAQGPFGGGSAALAFDAAVVVKGVFGLCGVALIVMGAGALNMLLEADVDGRMARTRDRPLASGRRSPGFALGTGLLWIALSLPLLALCGNALTLGLGLFSLFLYVLVYTPMKQRSPWSLVVGAIPGAMPALMGGTLARGEIDVTGAALFAVVFLWQMPHFLAISLYREPEYVAAGHKVFTTSLGIPKSKLAVTASTVLLSLLGVALWPLGLGGLPYAVVAAAAGVWFSVKALRGLAPLNNARVVDDKWAKKVFIASLIWQTVIFGALAVDRLINALLG